MPRIRCLALTWLTICLSSLLATDAEAQTDVFPVPTVNGSVAITTGNTFQQILPAVPVNSRARRSLTIQNNNDNATCEASSNCDYCWIFIGSGTPTEAKSIQLAATQAYTRYYPYVPSDVIQATCTTTSDTLYVDTQ